MSPRAYKVAGIDGCKGGWVVAVISAATGARGGLRYSLAVESIRVSPHFADVLLRTYDCKLVCVDIPIGLSDGPEPRACDVAARRLLGRRASSVFTPPVRPCLSATSYKDASAIQSRYTGTRLSRQSFFIMDKIRQVDELITPAMQKRVCEIHPEVAFCVLNGGKPIRHNKKTPAGRTGRISLLARIFPAAIAALEGTGRTREFGTDDVLDALAAAWTGAKALVGQVATLPERPERDSKGLCMEILIPVR